MNAAMMPKAVPPTFPHGAMPSHLSAPRPRRKPTPMHAGNKTASAHPSASAFQLVLSLSSGIAHDRDRARRGAGAVDERRRPDPERQRDDEADRGHEAQRRGDGHVGVASW